jgi:hypothetical protein
MGIFQMNFRGYEVITDGKNLEEELIMVKMLNN